MPRVWCLAATGGRSPGGSRRERQESRREQGAASAGRLYRPTARRVSAPPVGSSKPPPQSPVGELACTHFELCSGCTLHSDLASPPALAECQAYFEPHAQDFQLDAGAIHHWRHRARLAVRAGPNGRPVIGLFREGSHEAVAIPRCVAHHPAINRAAAVVRACMEACGVAPFDEATGRGDLRYIQLTVLGAQGQALANKDSDASFSAGAPAAAVQLVLVWNAAGEGPPPRRLQRLADAIWAQAGIASSAKSQEQATAAHQGRQRRRTGAGREPRGRQQQQRQEVVYSIWANFQQGSTNTILGAGWRLLHGPELAWVRLGGADICFAPGSFMQVNSEATDRALQAIQQWVPPASTIVDLHAGVGTIGLSLAATRSPRWVRFVEINPLAEAPFRHSAALLAAAPGGSGSSNQDRSSSGGGSSSGGDSSPGSEEEGSGATPVLEYHVAAAGSDPGRWLAGAEVAIVDPPRKGLEPDLLQFLASGATLAPYPQLRRLIYLSCGWPALMRDCSALVGGGQWRVAHASGFLFFPGTNHIESLVVLDRQDSSVAV